MDDTTLTAVALAAAGLGVLALGVAALALLRLRRVRADLTVLGVDGTRTDLVRLAADQSRRLGRLAAEVDRLQSELTATGQDVRQSLRNVAVVRYDAFGDMGGRLSFSAAIVDDEGDGVVISSIHARAESRTYAKGVVGGRSSITLTPEEQQALASASGAPTPKATPKAGPNTSPKTRPKTPAGSRPKDAS